MASQTEQKEIVFDDNTKIKYELGSLLGKGGYAKCYKIQNVHTAQMYAGKVISKELLEKNVRNKKRLSKEIAIHKSLFHKHIVAFHSHFEDDDNVYIILELCQNKSLLEILKARKHLTENEVRYFLHQIVQACVYLHENKVVHRDLKLANIFIDDNMEVKVGDFGLATRIDYEGQKKMAVCGTPDFIAPEILAKHGYSFEVDVWSLGCIMYSLLVGMAPFKARTVKNTYTKIECNEYHIPSKIGKYAKALIQKILTTESSARPKMFEILKDDFFTHGYLPVRLPRSCLITTPRYLMDQTNSAPTAVTRKTLTDINKELKDKPSLKKLKLMQLDNSKVMLDWRI